MMRILLQLALCVVVSGCDTTLEADRVPDGKVDDDGTRKAKVGEECQMTVVDAGSGVISSSQLDTKSQSCESQLCVYAGLGVGSPKPLCAAFCNSGADCPTATADCPGGFICAPAMETTSIGCCPMCLCKDFLPGGVDPTDCKKLYPGGPPAGCP
jgi:hypothetical protein